MSQIDEIIEGLQIIRKHYPDLEAHFEHDEITCGGKEKMTEAEVKRMGELNWVYDDEEVWWHC